MLYHALPTLVPPELASEFEKLFGSRAAETEARHRVTRGESL